MHPDQVLPAYRACMRFLAGLLAVVFLLAPTTRPVLADNETILDDDAATVQIKGVWATSTSTSGYYGSSYRFRVAGDGSSTVTWPFAGPAAQYEVFARWTSGPNRASNAIYVITHATGNASVSVDQRANGGAWQSLGTFAFSTAPDQAIRLSDNANGTVVADAVRWVPAGSPTSQVLAAPATVDQRFFSETRFRIDSDPFWDFFQK